MNKQTQSEFLADLKVWQKETLEHLYKEHGGEKETTKTLREGIVAIKNDTPDYADNIIFWWGTLRGLHMTSKIIIEPKHEGGLELTDRMNHAFLWSMLIVVTMVIEDSEKN